MMPTKGFVSIAIMWQHYTEDRAAVETGFGELKGREVYLVELSFLVPAFSKASNTMLGVRISGKTIGAALGSAG